MPIQEVTLNGAKMPIREFKLDHMVQKDFNINDLGRLPSICMIAKRGSGKSWVCRAILKHFRHLPGGVIIAPTDRMNAFYGTFFPGVYIHYAYSSEVVERILFRQKKMIEKSKEKAKKA